MGSIDCYHVTFWVVDSTSSIPAEAFQSSLLHALAGSLCHFLMVCRLFSRFFSAMTTSCHDCRLAWFGGAVLFIWSRSGSVINKLRHGSESFCRKQRHFAAYFALFQLFIFSKKHTKTCRFCHFDHDKRKRWRPKLSDLAKAGHGWHRKIGWLDAPGCLWSCFYRPPATTKPWLTNFGGSLATGLLTKRCRWM